MIDFTFDLPFHCSLRDFNDSILCFFNFLELSLLL